VTEPQRWHDTVRGMEQAPEGNFVTYADAKEWVEAEVAAAVTAVQDAVRGPLQEWAQRNCSAEQRGREVVIVTQETHDAVKELCRAAYEQGQRDERRAHAAMLPHVRALSCEQGQRDERARIRRETELQRIISAYPLNDAQGGYNMGLNAALAVIDGTAPQDEPLHWRHEIADGLAPAICAPCSRRDGVGIAWDGHLGPATPQDSACACGGVGSGCRCEKDGA